MLVRGLSIILSLMWCAQAEVREPLPVERLAKEAAIVVRAEVISKTVQRDPATGIFTVVEMTVREVWKGALAERSIRVAHAGGILGETGRRVSGQSEYRPEEGVVLFLTPGKDGRWVTVAGADGKWSVRREANGVERAERAGRTGVEAVAVKELEARVRKAVAGE